MKIQFNKVVIHNFLSIGDAALELDNQGFVLVEGNNNNKSDGAKSNGSGKSSLFNSICWCLTGETLQGLSSNIPNIHGEDGCFVELSFKVDNDEYIVTRYREYAKIKNNLKISINGEDKSGKTLRESENLLKQYLPDVTPNLIGNVIMLGQGLPHKFSNNTPSGRKELLETLSKSDYMIQDIRNRLDNRLKSLNDNLREQQDLKLANTTQLQVYSKQLEDNRYNLSIMDEIPLKQAINSLEEQIKDRDEQCTKLEVKIDSITPEIDSLIGQIKLKEIDLNGNVTKLENLLNTFKEEGLKDLTSLKATIDTKKENIIHLDSVVDVCPTCGQKLINVHKVGTTSLKEELARLEEEYNTNYQEFEKEKSSLESNISIEKENNASKLASLNKQLNSLNKELLDAKSNLTSLKVNSNLDSELAIKKAELENFNSNKKKLEDTIISLEIQVNELNDKILYNTNEIESISNHIQVVTKMNTLAKRDFRSVLLTNVIEFLDSKVKEYCKYVFNSTELNIYLDGNNLNISYDSKDYANLSGGEQQKVDIVVQLAIRDMMCKYLGFNSSMIVIDEVFDNLDQVGVDGVINLITHVLTDVNSLFIISHHSDELNIPYDNKIIIKKEEDGVSRL